MLSLPGRRHAAAFAPFRFDAFRYLWLGSAITMSMHFMQQVAQGWLVYELTSSPMWLGLVGAARGLPMLVFSLPFGVLVDRLERRGLLIAVQALIAVIAVVLAALIIAQLIEPWQIVLTAFLGGMLMTVVFPTRQALVPATVDRPALGAAVALASAGHSAGRIFGPSLAGVLIAGLGVATAFALQAAGLMVAALMTFRLPRQPAASQTRDASIGQNMMEGLRFIRGDDRVRVLMVLAVIPAFVTMPHIHLLPIFARDILHSGPEGLGLLSGAYGLGSVVAAVVAAGLPQRRQSWILFGSLGLTGLLLAGLGLSTSFPLSVTIMALMGMAQAVYISTNTTLLHLAVPDALRGRVISAYMTTWGLMPLGTLPQGALADLFGAPAVVAVAGLLTIVFVAALAIRVPPFESRTEPHARPRSEPPVSAPTTDALNRPQPVVAPDQYDRG